jgi:hypothetical protein
VCVVDGIACRAGVGYHGVRDTTQIYPFEGKPPGTWNLVTAMADDAIDWLNRMKQIDPSRGSAILNSIASYPSVPPLPQTVLFVHGISQGRCG